MSGPRSLPKSSPRPIRSARARSASPDTKRSWSGSSTKMRSTPEQTWPQLKNDPHAAPSRARSTSASAKTSIGSLPPSSSVTGQSRSPAAAATWRPTSAEPVKKTLAMPRARTSAAPSSPSPWTTRTSPFGAPASSNTRSTHAPESGVSSDGFTSTAFPAATAIAVSV